MHKRISIPILLLSAVVGCSPGESTESEAPQEAGPPHVVAESPIEAGRYLVIVGGCSDCHTHGYLQSGGDVPEEMWLLGSTVGWRGPWGTTYAKNLRLTAAQITEDTWVELVHSGGGLPPMPWINVAVISDTDARAIYQYLRALGPAGEMMPVPVPPDQEPTTPYINLTTVEPE